MPLTHALLVRAGLGRLAHAITAAGLTALAAELGLDRSLTQLPAGSWDKPRYIQRYAELCRKARVTLSSHALTQLGGEGCTLRAQAARHWGGFRAFQREAVAAHPELSPPRICLAGDGTRMDSWNEVLAYNVIRRVLPEVPVPARDRFVVLRDRDGRRQAIARQAVSALCEDEGGGTLLLPGGRLVAVEDALDTMLALFA